MTKVSICIPTYNTGKYLSFAVESALSQSFKDIEVIVCDNASTDDTQDLLSKYRDERLKVFRNDSNIGMIRNFNRCVELASGKYIKFLEADDILETDCVVKMVNIAEQYPNVGIISCGRKLIDSAGNVIGEHKKEKTEVVKGSVIVSRIRRMGNEMATPTDVMVLRSLLSRTGLFDVGFGNYLNEWDLWMRCAEISDVGFIAGSLTRVRRHPEQVGATGAKDQIDIDSAFRFIKNYDLRKKKLGNENTARDSKFRLFMHFSEEYIWRGLLGISMKPNAQSVIFFIDALSRIKKNIGFIYLTIALIYALFHCPVYWILRINRKYQSRI